MDCLMTYEEVAEHLGLDIRDEKRDNLYLKAVSQQICAYLGRTLLTGTKTEKQRAVYNSFYVEEYPVREFIEIVEAKTGLPVSLAADTPVVDMISPDSYRNKCFRLERANEKDGEIEYTYRYGYEMPEIPAVIQACVLDLMSDRLDAVTSPDKTIPDPEDRLKNISSYRRVFL